MIGLIFRKHKKPNYEHIAQLERENGLNDGTFSDEWVEEMQGRLDRAGIGAPPEKRELFKAPIIEKKPMHPINSFAYSVSSVSSYSPSLHQIQRNPYSLDAGLKTVLPPGVSLSKFEVKNLNHKLNPRPSRA